ncbi:hypothetical protein C6497_16490 [Candidatus Poribacteria bacterium]|nr:MAG: hypothetical protein C6497_16490 [Candidatus Poribacteria bacterium]
MSEAKYPFRDSLRKAQDIYLDAASTFMEVRLGDVSYNDLDFCDISNLFFTHWRDSIEGHFRCVDKYYDARSVVKLIVEGRNRTSHPPWDLDPDYVRMQLYIIADFLGKISRNIDQQDVEKIIEDLFHDDTPERLVETEEKLKNVESEREKLEDGNIELQNDLDNLKKQLSDVESKNNKLESDMTKTSKDLIEKNQKIKTTSDQLKKSKERLKKSLEEKNASKERITSLEEEIEGMATDHKLEIKTLQEQLTTQKNIVFEKKIQIETLSDLLSIFKIAKQDDALFPPININSSIRIIDQRRINRKNYLLDLLKMNQPSIYYVRDVDQMFQYLTEEIPGISDLIEKHNQKTPKEDENKLLERLEEGELNTIVSNSTFSMLPKYNNNMHIVFCHLSPSIDVFVNRCQPAFLLENSCYLHLIFDPEKDMDSITKSYPDRDVISAFYKNLIEINGIKSNYISTADILQKLKMNKPEFDPYINILQDIGMIQENNNRIKLLSTPKKSLEDSDLYIDGLEKREKFQEFYEFQENHSCEELWDRIGEKAEISNILKDNNYSSMNIVYEEIEEYDKIDAERTDSTLE